MLKISAPKINLNIDSLEKKIKFGMARSICKIGYPDVGQHMLTVEDIEKVSASGLLSCNGNKGDISSIIA